MSSFGREIEDRLELIGRRRRDAEIVGVGGEPLLCVHVAKPMPLRSAPADPAAQA
jgi:hypothetical protein